MLHILKYTKTFIKTILYNFNNSILSALNFNILKTNLSKIASKEVKIYVFENYFLKKGVVQQLSLADKKMKSLLHLLALTSIRHDPELKLYYERKKEEGKHSLLVLNNVKCKLVSRIFAVIKRETPYVKTHQFAN